MITLIATVFGGLGLFLLGMRLMTNGLKLAAGSKLKDILKNWTDTKLRGLFSGVLVTAIVQSSSATTVATIGFVNAGLLTLSQAVAVVYGTNIGTTVTAWLVAIIGFKFDVKALALPLVGVGMLVKAFKGETRKGAIGEAIAGFGVFFLGIDILRGGFEGLGNIANAEFLTQTGIGSIIVLVLIGAALTFIMQSSSAALAIILTAASGGIVPIDSAAALVIGANIGTTTTAAIAAIGATPNAKRVAAAHMAFNFITGFVALLLLPLLIMVLFKFRHVMGFDSSPAAILALFHTMFNILGVCLLWPMTTPLVSFLERRFKTSEEDQAKPKHLDSNLVSTPELGLEALKLELIRIGQRIDDFAINALESIPIRTSNFSQFEAPTLKLLDAVNEYINLLRQGNLTGETSEKITSAMIASRYFHSAILKMHELFTFKVKASVLLHKRTNALVTEYHSLIKQFIKNHNDSASEERIKIKIHYEELKIQLFQLHLEKDIYPSDIISAIDYLNILNNFTNEIEKARTSLPNLEFHNE